MRALLEKTHGEDGEFYKNTAIIHGQGIKAYLNESIKYLFIGNFTKGKPDGGGIKIGENGVFEIGVFEDFALKKGVRWEREENKSFYGEFKITDETDEFSAK